MEMCGEKAEKIHYILDLNLPRGLADINWGSANNSTAWDSSGLGGREQQNNRKQLQHCATFDLTSLHNKIECDEIAL